MCVRASKRGWSTWTTAAVDKRVIGISPLVIDLLNMTKSFEHHYRAYGAYSEAVKDYEDMGLMNVLHTFDDEDRSWQDEANCLGVDPDLFFPERGASTREAKEVCRGCVVREECLEYALLNRIEHGVWGGASERERRRILRRRRDVATSPQS